MNKVDRERADVLRAELARLCWLSVHDAAGGGDAGHFLQERLDALRVTGTRASADMVSSSATTAIE